jgi:hypothetical protein
MFNLAYLALTVVSGSWHLDDPNQLALLAEINSLDPDDPSVFHDLSIATETAARAAEFGFFPTIADKLLQISLGEKASRFRQALHEYTSSKKKEFLTKEWKSDEEKKNEIASIKNAHEVFTKLNDQLERLEREYSGHNRIDKEYAIGEFGRLVEWIPLNVVVIRVDEGENDHIVLFAVLGLVGAIAAMATMVYYYFKNKKD